MEHFRARLVGNEFEEWSDIEIVMHRIDNDLKARTRCLDQAEFRPVSCFPMELGIYAKEFPFSESSTHFVELVLFGDRGEVGTGHRTALDEAAVLDEGSIATSD